MAEFIEYVFVVNQICTLPAGQDVLCFGCNNDEAIDRLSAGYRVAGIDLARPKGHINYRFMQTDIFDYKPTILFDATYAVSTVEHVGLCCYDKHKDEDGDKKAIKKMYDLTAPKGMILFTFPYGTYPRDKTWRTYNKETLKNLLQPYHADVFFYPAIAEIMMNKWRKNKYRVHLKAYLADLGFDITALTKKQYKELEQPLLETMCLKTYDSMKGFLPNIPIEQDVAETVPSVACVKIIKGEAI